MKNLRIGIAGLGAMGTGHARSILNGKVPRALLAAVADPVADLSRFGSDVKGFSSSEEMIALGQIDAVVVATPHFSHTSLGIQALERGLHVLVEKPISVHKADAERLIAAHTDRQQIFAAMFNLRGDPRYLKLRQLIRSGELGAIRRINWIATDWFRTDTYYRSGSWRATWAGEGGGVLLNQCPHNLDLMQWLFGMPERVRATCRFGRYHAIEVEDEVTAFLEFPNGATGVFITSTGEAPGTNRLEIAAERGRVVLEDGVIRWRRNEVEMSEFSRTTPMSSGGPPVWNIEVPVCGAFESHIGILKNFVDAILDGTPLIAPAQEGIHSVELANAMLMSQFLDRTIDLPLDAALYEHLLQKKIRESSFLKSRERSQPAAGLVLASKE